MVSDKEWVIGHSDPASTDGDRIFLPTSLPLPVEPGIDLAGYRCMALLQADFVEMGFVQQREWMAELHRDWVLQCTCTLLMARTAVRTWSRRFPGVLKDLSQVRGSRKLCALRVGTQIVSSDGMPEPFSSLLVGLADGYRPVDWVEQILAPLDKTDSPLQARVVLAGVAQSLREAFRERRLGAPPIPLWVGALHPAWFLADEAADRIEAEAWRKGPKPLQSLLRKLAGRSSDSRATTAPGQRWVQPPVVVSTSDGVRYDEWDGAQSRYRLDAVRVVEEDAPTGPREAVDRIRETHRDEILEIVRRFTELKLEQRWLHAQVDGSEIDLQQAVTALTDMIAGQNPSDHIYRRFQRERKPIAVLTLVDLSGSTNGRILAEEQTAVVLFSEALKALGVPHSFFGFSGDGPQTCRFQRIQDWIDDPLEVQKRMGSLVARGGSRLGAHIRHATARLQARPEAQRILLMLSDGKPEDGEAYRGSHGIQDTAVAVREAHRFGIHIHCISLDSGDQGYLRTIFGPNGFTVVKDAASLPMRLPEVFRSLVR
jgi:Mg-chelatase subunit ChlD